MTTMALTMALTIVGGIALTMALTMMMAHAYELRDPVPVIVNNIGPFHNPAETYEFYSLPFCMPKDVHSKSKNLGEALAGDHRVSSLYNLRFKVGVEWQELCHFTLSVDEINAFIDAIDHYYVFEMFVDGLPVRGFVGEWELANRKVGDHSHNVTSYYLFSHLDFSIAYNEHDVIAVNLTTDPVQRVMLGIGGTKARKPVPIEFSFSVRWKYTPVPFVDRLSLHSKSTTGEQDIDIHWLSIINSLVLLLLLMSLLAVILVRILRKDIAMALDDEEQIHGESVDHNEEGGWKLLHGDVFRMPAHTMLFSSLVGTGTQMISLVVGILLLSLVGTFYPGNRGALYTSAVVLYALTAGIAGYISTRLYIQFGGEHWATSAVLTACIFAMPFFFIFAVINSIAIAYGSTSALPLGTIVIVVLMWALITFPLTIIGSLRGKNSVAEGGAFDAPTNTNRVGREIPTFPWYRHRFVHLVVAGFPPFSAIYIELHYVFMSVWGHRVYTLFGILSLVFLLLLIVAAFTTVTLTYFQLASEDYHWWWRSFLSGGSAGFFIYVYAAFFFMFRSQMTGVLQGAFFFGYMFIVSYAFFLMLGAVGFWTSLRFVRYIFGYIKVD